MVHENKKKEAVNIKKNGLEKRGREEQGRG